MKSKKNLWVIGVLVCAVAVSGCGKGPAKQAVPAVTVTTLEEEPVLDYIDLTGTVRASQSATLLARVPGYLRAIKFNDGTFVDEGQMLFVIEPEPYEQQLKLQEAALLMAASELDHQQGLMKENATSKANVEKWQSQRDQAAAQVEIAKINLSYTQVTAPFKGRIARHLVDVGNLVGSGANTPLADIDQITPVYVYFNLNERDALDIRAMMRAHNWDPRLSIGKAKVLVGLETEQGFPHEGVFDYVDNGIDSSLGTIEMRAVFANEDRALIPGAFTRVRVPLGEPKPMVVVPQNVFLSDQEGDYVLTVDANDVVVKKMVVKGPLTEKGAAIKSGLKAGDRVIVAGFMQAVPGAKAAPQKGK